MSVFRAIVGAVMLAYVLAAPIAGAMTHPQFSPVSFSGHDVVVQAAGRINLDRPTSSTNEDKKKCLRDCSNRERYGPSN